MNCKLERTIPCVDVCDLERGFERFDDQNKRPLPVATISSTLVPRMRSQQSQISSFIRWGDQFFVIATLDHFDINITELE